MFRNPWFRKPLNVCVSESGSTWGCVRRVRTAYGRTVDVRVVFVNWGHWRGLVSAPQARSKEIARGCFRNTQPSLGRGGAGLGSSGGGPAGGAEPRRLQQRGPGQGAPSSAAARECDAVRSDGRARWAGDTAALQRCDSDRGPAGASALRGRGGR